MVGSVSTHTHALHGDLPTGACNIAMHRTSPPLLNTTQDDDASLIIHGYVDEIMTNVLRHLDQELSPRNSTVHSFPGAEVKTET